MNRRRTDPVALDLGFNALGDVQKTRVDARTGKRYITGLASGVREDQDGERVSARAIKKMAAQPTLGIKIVASHEQDWLTEFGDVVKLGYDPVHDELSVECELPPEGEDPIADKAFKKANREPLGFSIGGKLLRGFHELVDDGEGGVRKRKVLDEIFLRHVCLTKKPSYAPSFAEAIAKTWDGDAPAEDAEGVWKDERRDDDAEFGIVMDRTDELRKAKKDEPDEPADAAAADESAADDPPAGSATAGPGKDGDDAGDQADDVDSNENEDAKDAEALPMAKRHLACPNCGHEFAAPLSADEPANRNETSNGADDDVDVDKTSDSSETMSEAISALDTALAGVRTLADVSKTETAPEAKPAVPAAAAIEDGDTDVVKVAKAIAAVHREADERLTAIEERTAEGFDRLVNVVKSLGERLEALPAGRRSVARADGAPTRDETAADGATTVGKTRTLDTEDDVRKAVDEATDPKQVLLILNDARERGIAITA